MMRFTHTTGDTQALRFLLPLAFLSLMNAAGSGQSPELIGHVRAAREFRVAPEVAGIVISREAQRGTYLRKGDVILRLDNRSQILAIRRAEAAIKLAEANLHLAELEWKRVSGLRRSESIGQSEADAAKARVEIRTAELEAMRINLEDAKLQLDRTQIRAPADGTLTELSPDLGSYVGPQTTVAEILSTKELVVEAFASSDEFKRIQDSEVVLVRGKGKEVSCQVLERTPATSTRRTHRLVLKLAPDVKSFIPGETVRVVLP